MVALDGEVVVIGGFDAQAQVVDRVEAYDPDENSWRSLAALPAARHHVNAAVVGGQIYAPSARSSASASPPPATSGLTIRPAMAGSLALPCRAAASAAVLPSPSRRNHHLRRGRPSGRRRRGRCLRLRHGRRRMGAAAIAPRAPRITSSPVPSTASSTRIGGRQGGIGGIEGNVFAFDPAQPGWTEVAPMITPRGGTAAATLPDGRIVVLGGEGNLDAPTGVFAEVEAFDAAADSWQALDPMTTPRHGTGAAAIDGVILHAWRCDHPSLRRRRRQPGRGRSLNGPVGVVGATFSGWATSSAPSRGRYRSKSAPRSPRRRVEVTRARCERPHARGSRAWRAPPPGARPAGSRLPSR